MATSYIDSSSDGEFNNENAEDLSYGNLTSLPEFLLERARDIRALRLNQNEINILPRTIKHFSSLITLDLSNNNLSYLSDEIVQLRHLRTFIAKNNHIKSVTIPKDFGRMSSLEVLNLSGNEIKEFPLQITELFRLRDLHLGGNSIMDVPNSIKNLSRLEVLYLGGNRLTDIPAEVGDLCSLTSLTLCDNQLQSLPPTFINLRRLQSLSLHSNNLSTLPQEIVSLNLVELSLRNNPLVVKFVQDMVDSPPSLLELSGRVVKIEKLQYKEGDLPQDLINYLQSARRCVNPKCKGVYFSSCVEHVKFVDFCGKYRLPLLQYLCSPMCCDGPAMYPNNSESDTDDEDTARARLRRVLLG
ncbi:leucine-rich repeat-containing protein 58-like [Pecten maximus]|uniref:leucine-rich repeat-containing protein 58-like n=1 Tax=Pecten maximus TaxID=6579 RepID=UPI001458D790|nr:leucine-rich repeat-containing protein 58-like [Pecten maximus]